MYFSDCMRCRMSIEATCPVSFSCRLLLMYVDLMTATNILNSNSNTCLHAVTPNHACELM